MKGLLEEGIKIVAVVCSNPKHTNIIIYGFERRKCNKGKNGHYQYNNGYLISHYGKCKFVKAEEIEL